MKFKIPTLHPIRLQPQPIEEDDELAKAIVNDFRTRDDAWELTEFTDGEALEHFWEEASREKTNDTKDFS